MVPSAAQLSDPNALLDAICRHKILAKNQGN